MIDMKLAWKRYNKQKYRCDRGLKLDAAGNPVEMRMTFAEWLMVWIESGQYHLRGVGKGQYCMARHNDIGHYKVGNVRIILNSKNSSEAHKGKPKSAEACAKMSAAQKGKTGRKWTPEQIAKRIATVKALGKPSPLKGKPTGRPSPLKGIPMTKTQCVHCGIWASPSTMKRWHGDNCKKAPI